MCIYVINPSKYSHGPTVDNHLLASKIQSQSFFPERTGFKLYRFSTELEIKYV